MSEIIVLDTYVWVWYVKGDTGQYPASWVKGENMVVDSRLAGNRNIDPEGIEIAALRDAEIEHGVVQAIGDAAFLRLTGGGSECLHHRRHPDSGRDRR